MTIRGSDGSPPVLRARLSPKKLLLTKWTAVTPRWKEKHFLVTKVVEPEVEGGRIEFVELEAVYTKHLGQVAALSSGVGEPWSVPALKALVAATVIEADKVLKEAE